MLHIFAAQASRFSRATSTKPAQFVAETGTLCVCARVSVAVSVLVQKQHMTSRVLFFEQSCVFYVKSVALH